jgi:hypothetical protein
MPRNDDVACLMRDRAGEASSLVRLNHNQEDFASSGCEYRNGPVAVVTTVASFAKRAAGTPLTAVRTETPRLTSSPPSWAIYHIVHSPNDIRPRRSCPGHSRPHSSPERIRRLMARRLAADAPWRKPITGRGDYCARAGSGQDVVAADTI